MRSTAVFVFLVGLVAAAAGVLAASVATAQTAGNASNRAGGGFARDAGAKKAAPAASLAINTPDGLPLEVQLVSVHREVAKVRSVASNAEYELKLELADKPTKAAIQQLVNIARQSVVEPALPHLGISLVHNTTDSRSAAAGYNTVKVQNPVFSYRPATADRDVQPGSPTTDVINLSTGSALLRFRSVEVGDDVKVDLPLDFYVVWMIDGAFQAQSYKLLLTDKRGDFITSSVSIGKSRNFLYGVAVVNPATGKIIWRRGSGAALRQAVNNALNGGRAHSPPAPVKPAQKTAPKKNAPPPSGGPNKK